MLVLTRLGSASASINGSLAYLLSCLHLNYLETLDQKSAHVDMTMILQEGHTTLVNHVSTVKVLKIVSTTVIKDIYTLSLTLVRLNQSRGSILKTGFTQASSAFGNSPTSL